MLFQIETAQAPVQPETLFFIKEFPITNAMLTGAGVTVLLLVFFFILSKKLKQVPGKTQAVIESLVEGFVQLLQQITGTEHVAKKILPLVGTLFIFFGLSNMITLFPPLASFTYNEIPLLRTPTSDFNMTFSIALAMVVLTQVASVKAFGFFRHIGKFIKFKEIFLGFRKGFGAGMFAVVEFLIGLLDIVSEVAKVASLSLRLFGNMFAGETIAGILLGSFALFVPAPWLAMNLFVALIQAVVFGSLTAAYYTLAIDMGEAEAERA